ncbi:MAG TPA: hypothetical protein VK971_02525 [Thiohalobacter sp.]|nr:hypothetical protein [Thiohalobacter sp.]
MYTFFKWTRVLFGVLFTLGMAGLFLMGLVFDAGGAVMKPLGFATGVALVALSVSSLGHNYWRYRREGGTQGFWQWQKTLEGADEDDDYFGSDQYFSDLNTSPLHSDLLGNMYYDHDRYH